MIVGASTTQDEMELLKARASQNKLKELLELKDFIVEEAMILHPEDGEENQRTQAAIKVDGRYFKGISEKVVETVQLLIGWQEKRTEQMAVVCKMEKGNSRYDSMILVIL